MPKTRLLLSVVAIALFGLLLVTSCFAQGSANAFFDAGTGDISISGEQLAQYVLYSFDTSTSGCTLTLPPAADIVSQISSPTVGQLFIMVVTVDGVNPVTVVGGEGMVVKPSAAEVAGNHTQNLYFVVTNIKSGTQSITVY